MRPQLLLGLSVLTVFLSTSTTGIVTLVVGLPATGVLFPEQTAASLAAALARFEALAPLIHPEDCRRNAMRFSRERFRAAMRGLAEDALGGEARLRDAAAALAAAAQHAPPPSRAVELAGAAWRTALAPEPERVLSEQRA